MKLSSRNGLFKEVNQNVQITKNLKHHHYQQNANRTINFRQNSKNATEMVWTPPQNGRPKTIYQWTLHGRGKRGRPQQSWKDQVTDFMRGGNMKENMAEEGHFWRLGMDRRLLAVQILIIKQNYFHFCTVRFPSQQDQFHSSEDEISSQF